MAPPVEFRDISPPTFRVPASVMLIAPPFEVAVRFPPTIPDPKESAPPAPLEVTVKFPVAREPRANPPVASEIWVVPPVRSTGPAKLLFALLSVMAKAPALKLDVSTLPRTVIPSVVCVIAPPAVMFRALATEIAPSRMASMSVKFKEPDPVIVPANSSTSFSPGRETVPESVIESAPTRTL